jgi:hypothetical protein
LLSIATSTFPHLKIKNWHLFSTGLKEINLSIFRISSIIYKMRRPREKELNKRIKRN